MVEQATEIILGTPGVKHAVPFSGFDGATFTNASNAGAIFSPLDSVRGASRQGQSVGVVLDSLRQRLSAIQDAFVITIPPPPVAGIGTAGGFKMMLQDRRDLARPRWRRRHRTGRGRQPDPGPGRRVHAVQHPHAQCLSPTSTARRRRSWG